MYRAFDLCVKDSILQSLDIDTERLLVEGEKAIESVDKKTKKILDNVTVDGTIDGTKLSDGVFPIIQSDVFISYSHDDEALVKMIVGLLTSVFGLSIFIDSLFWGSADSLLKSIDDRYCKNAFPSNDYDYNKRNFSTSHVHAMLTSAIMKAIDEAEVVIFINTPNSVPDLKNSIDRKGYDEYTLSPWIYEELLCTSLIRQRDWEEYRIQAITESMHYRFDSNEKLNIKYKLPKDNLIPLTMNDITEWSKRYQNKDIRHGRYGGLNKIEKRATEHALNYLYRIVEERITKIGSY